MDDKTFNEREEKIDYEEYMLAEGYIKLDGQWILGKYSDKDAQGYKVTSPKKKD